MWRLAKTTLRPMMIMFVALLLPGTPGQACSAPAALPQVIARILPSVVTVEATRIDATAPSGGPPAHTTRQIGAGFIIDADGTIVTNLHVIAASQDILVTLQDGTELSAAPGPRSPETDLALLTVHPPYTLQTVRFGDSDRLRAGDTVIAVGNPYGLSNTVSTGIVSALNRDIGESDYDDYIQTDAAINHGNSGGPLFDMNGEVIGINSVIFAPAGSGGSIGLGFAMPSNDLRFAIGQLRRYGYLRHGFVGIAFRDATPQMMRYHKGGARQVIVTAVAPNTPAALAGLQVGDTVERFADLPIVDGRALARAIAEAPIGERVDVVVSRSGSEERLTVLVVQAPPIPGAGVSPVMAAASAALGMTLAPLSPATRREQAAAPGQSGALVAGITKDQAAAAAGLHAGDIIVMAERHSIEGPEALMRVLRDARLSGASYAALLVLSDGRMRWVALALHMQVRSAGKP
jgi:serine protease Do